MSLDIHLKSLLLLVIFLGNDIGPSVTKANERGYGKVSEENKIILRSSE